MGMETLEFPSCLYQPIKRKTVRKSLCFGSNELPILWNKKVAIPSIPRDTIHSDFLMVLSLQFKILWTPKSLLPCWKHPGSNTQPAVLTVITTRKAFRLSRGDNQHGRIQRLLLLPTLLSHLNNVSIKHSPGREWENGTDLVISKDQLQGQNNHNHLNWTGGFIYP